jgi:hypothetical protein
MIRLSDGAKYDLEYNGQYDTEGLFKGDLFLSRIIIIYCLLKR